MYKGTTLSEYQIYLAYLDPYVLYDTQQLS